MAKIEVREEGDGVWIATVPGVAGREDLPDDFDVTPRPDVDPPISDTLEKLRHYLASIAPGAI
jgi:hypothetical protein